MWNADEGAVLAQAERIAAGESWAQPWDLESTATEPSQNYPIENSEQGNAGWAPYAKLPLVPLVFAGALMLGSWGVSLVGLVATLGSAATAWFIAFRLRPGSEALAYWATAIGTPLLANTFAVWAHPLGCAVFGLAILGLEGTFRHRRAWALVFALSLLVGPQLRNELVIVGIVLAVTVVFAGIARREMFLGIVGFVGLSMIATSYGVARLAHATIVAEPQASALSTGGRTIASRIDTVNVMILGASPGTMVASTAALGVAGLVLGSFALGVNRRELGLIGVGLGAVMLLWMLASNPHARPVGVLVAAPIVAVGLGLIRFSPGHLSWFRWALGGTATAMVFVVLASYDGGGAGEWGSRYLVWSMPFLVPMSIVSVRAANSRVTGFPIRVLSTAIVVVSLAFAVQSLRTIDRAQAGAADVADAASWNRSDPNSTALILLSHPLGRFAYEEVERGNAITVPPNQVSRVGRELAASGSKNAVIVGRSEAVEAIPPSELGPVLGRSRFGRYEAVLVDLAHPGADQ